MAARTKHSKSSMRTYCVFWSDFGYNLIKYYKHKEVATDDLPEAIHEIERKDIEFIIIRHVFDITEYV